jgi:sugar phosphate isomerase/epimerase
LRRIVELTKSYGLDRLQVCENAQPTKLPHSAWRDLIQCAAQEGVELQLGCKTLNIETLKAHLERVAGTLNKTLRIVLEEDGEPPPTRSRLETFLERAAPLLEKAASKLAIENYFAIPSHVLAEIVGPYPSSSVGFCVDTANSLRKFEPSEYVLKLLGSRAFCYHIKDYKVAGDNVGFSVGGAPLGKGDLALDKFLDAVFARNPSPEFFLENWVPATGRRETDVEADALWLQESLLNLRERLSHRGV